MNIMISFKEKYCDNNYIITSPTEFWCVFYNILKYRFENDWFGFDESDEDISKKVQNAIADKDYLFCYKYLNSRKNYEYEDFFIELLQKVDCSSVDLEKIEKLSVIDILKRFV